MLLSMTSRGGGIPIPQSYNACGRLILSDYYRIYGRSSSLIKIWFVSIRDHCIKYLFWMRLSAYRGWLFPITKLFQEHFGKKFGLDIPPDTRIGYGFYLGHGFSIVINHTAVIGNNVNISQCSTIGSNNNHAAIIGDRVYNGPNTCIIDNVTVGNDTIIGAGSVVTKTIDCGVMAVGAPCKEIGKNSHPEYICNDWQIE